MATHVEAREDMAAKGGEDLSGWSVYRRAEISVLGLMDR